MGIVPKFYKAPWGKPLKSISLLATILLLALGSLGVSLITQHLPMIVVLGVLLPGPIILITCGCFAIRGYGIELDAVLVHRPFWTTRLPRSGLQSARFEPDAMRGSIRTCGNGGLFSFTGF
jgi:hypothetical protein